MACGYGACYGCVVELDGGLERLCIEGPVLGPWGARNARSGDAVSVAAAPARGSASPPEPARDGV
jgi:hypothetical protein